MKRLLYIFLISANIASFASIETDMTNFFNSHSLYSNITTPAAFNSQAAGFYGGGSLFVRSKVSHYQLVRLDLPSYKSGCNGIDLFTGSLSFLNHKKLTDLGHQIMNSSGAYAVDVLLATTVPELKQVRDYLQTLEQKINHMNINSCEAAQNFVGGVFPKTAASQEKICHDQAINGKSGILSDYVSARMECASDKHDDIMDEAKEDKTQNKKIVLNKNIIWTMLQNNAFLSSDKELSEMVMSLTGTIIIDAQGHVKIVPALIKNGHFIEALLGNKSLTTLLMWRCTGLDNLCLNVELKETTINYEHTLSAKVRKIIEELDRKIKKDESRTKEEENFLNLTIFPVMKFLMVLNSSHYNDAAVELDGYVTLIAEDLLSHYLSGLLDTLASETASLELNEDLVKDIEKRIRMANQEVAAIDPKINRKLQEKLGLISRMGEIEKQLAGGFNNALH